MTGKISKFKIILLSFLIIIFIQEKLFGYENKIIIKVDNQIITTLDLENEINYLKALNPNLKNFNKNEIFKISKNSIIKEKIKLIEIKKNIENPKLPEEFLNKLIKNVYKNIGINTLEDFKKYLSTNNVNYINVLKKIETEALWNELIISKFSKKIKINKKQLKKNILENANKENRSYLMSEIFFELLNKETLEEKYNQIKETISTKGFGNAAIKFSLSETANTGGKLDWINESSLNKKIKNAIKLLNSGDYSEPISVPGGFLILKINELKTIETKINIDEELKKMIKVNKNYQFNQFSKIYFNKVKENLDIDEI